LVQKQLFLSKTMKKDWQKLLWQPGGKLFFNVFVAKGSMPACASPFCHCHSDSHTSSSFSSWHGFITFEFPTPNKQSLYIFAKLTDTVSLEPVSAVTDKPFSLLTYLKPPL
jgi:hypothetical protein